MVRVLTAGAPRSCPNAPIPIGVFCLFSCAALARERFFEEEAFVKYLEYLQYWKDPQYARFLMYPQCLAFLDLLQDERFRQVRSVRLANVGVMEMTFVKCVVDFSLLPL